MILSLNLQDKKSKTLKEFFSNKVYSTSSNINLVIPPREAVIFCGQLVYSVNKNKTTESNFIFNGSFEKSGKNITDLPHWRSRRDSFPAVRSAKIAVDGKYSALLESDGTKNVVMIQHIDPKVVAKFSKLQISMQIFVDSYQAGLIIPIQLIVVTDENGKRKSNYPGARFFSKTGDGTGAWVRVQKEYDLRKYKNVKAVELWITGWDYKKTPFKGSFAIDDVKVIGIK